MRYTRYRVTEANKYSASSLCNSISPGERLKFWEVTSVCELYILTGGLGNKTLSLISLFYNHGREVWDKLEFSANFWKSLSFEKCFIYKFYELEIDLALSFKILGRG